MPRKLRQKIEGTMYREMQLRADGILDEDERLVKISISSELPVTRKSFFSDPWVETLGHKRGEPNLERMQNGASVHYNHSRTRADRIGVVESVKLVTVKDGKRAAGGSTKMRRLEGVVRISKREDVDDVWQDIKDGILRNISVGYTIDERKLTREASGQGAPDEFRITSWTPMEVSFVDIPADPSVGVGRSDSGELSYRVIDLEPEKEANKMFRFDANGNPLPDTAEARAAILAGTATREDGSPFVADSAMRALCAPPAPAPVVLPTPAPAVDKDALRAEGVATERKRVADINAIFTPFESSQAELRAVCVDNADCNLEDARAQLLVALGKDSTPAQTADALRIESGEDGVDKFVRGAGIALAIRAGTVTADERKAHDNSFAGFSLVEIARHALHLTNVNTGQMSRMELVGRAFTSSDFPLILANQANKSMLKGYDEAPETWNTWAQTGNLTDFKQASRVNLSTFDNLDLVSEDGEYKYGSFSENGENIQLATYGKLFAISRQAIINDDLGMFTRVPSSMGRAASRTVGNLAYGVITSNPLMSDGLALFAGTAIGTDHGNLNLGGAAVISAASVGLARQGMARQTDSAANAVGLNIRPQFLIVPLALEDVANVLMASEFNPSDVSSNNRAPNVARNTLEVVVDARLDADSSTRWYESAGQSFDTIEVAFLDGNQAPTLEQQNGWSIDGTEFKVRIDVAAAPMDFRTWQRNDGV
jgi:hypothetical protein